MQSSNDRKQMGIEKIRTLIREMLKSIQGEQYVEQAKEIAAINMKFLNFANGKYDSEEERNKEFFNLFIFVIKCQQNDKTRTPIIYSSNKNQVVNNIRALVNAFYSQEFIKYCGEQLETCQPHESYELSILLNKAYGLDDQKLMEQYSIKVLASLSTAVTTVSSAIRNISFSFWKKALPKTKQAKQSTFKAQSFSHKTEINNNADEIAKFDVVLEKQNLEAQREYLNIQEGYLPEQQQYLKTYKAANPSDDYEGYFNNIQKLLDDQRRELTEQQKYFKLQEELLKDDNQPTAEKIRQYKACKAEYEKCLSKYEAYQDQYYDCYNNQAGTVDNETQQIEAETEIEMPSTIGVENNNVEEQQFNEQAQQGEEQILMTLARWSMVPGSLSKDVQEKLSLKPQ